MFMSAQRRKHAARTARQRLGSMMLTMLLGLQAICLAVFASDPGGAPLRGGLLEAMWMNRRPGLAMAFVALIGLGPVLSLALWRCAGWRRWLMIAMWIAFIVLLDGVSAQKMGSVSRVLWFWKVQPWLNP